MTLYKLIGLKSETLFEFLILDIREIKVVLKDSGTLPLFKARRSTAITSSPTICQNDLKKLGSYH